MIINVFIGKLKAQWSIAISVPQCSEFLKPWITESWQGTLNKMSFLTFLLRMQNGAATLEISLFLIKLRIYLLYIYAMDTTNPTPEPFALGKWKHMHQEKLCRNVYSIFIPDCFKLDVLQMFKWWMDSKVKVYLCVG